MNEPAPSRGLGLQESDSVEYLLRGEMQQTGQQQLQLWRGDVSSVAAHIPTVAPGLLHLDGRWEGIRDQRHGDDRCGQEADRCGHGELEPVVFMHGQPMLVGLSVMASTAVLSHPPWR